MKEFVTGKKPEGHEFFEAIKKPVVVNFTQIEDDDFCVKDIEGNVEAKGSKGDYLILGKYESLHVLSKDEMEGLFDTEVDENFKVKRYLMSKVNRDGAATLASQFDELMRSNWFTIEKAAKRAKESEEEMQRKLFLLQAFGFVETSQDKKDNTNYKVRLDKEDRKRVIEKQKQYLSMQIDYLNQEIENLENVPQDSGDSSVDQQDHQDPDQQGQEDGGKTIPINSGEDK